MDNWSTNTIVQSSLQIRGSDSILSLGKIRSVHNTIEDSFNVIV